MGFDRWFIDLSWSGGQRVVVHGQKSVAEEFDILEIQTVINNETEIYWANLDSYLTDYVKYITLPDDFIKLIAQTCV